MRFAALGGAALCFDLALWNTSVLYTSAANATLLANTAPLWVAIAAAVFFKERLSLRFWTGLLLVLSGAAAVLGADFLRDFHLGLGDLMAITAGVFYAGYYLATQAGRRHLPSLPYVAAAGVTATILLLGIVLLMGLPLTGYPLQTFAAFAALGLVTQVLGYVSVGYALGHLPASLVAPTMVGQPVMTALLAIPLLGESLSPVQWIGGGRGPARDRSRPPISPGGRIGGGDCGGGGCPGRVARRRSGDQLGSVVRAGSATGIPAGDVR